MSRDRWRKGFIAAREKAGIQRIERNLMPHSFRHTLNTLLLEAGCDILKVQAFFGWSSKANPILTPVHRCYTHLDEADKLRELVPVIENIFEW